MDQNSDAPDPTLIDPEWLESLARRGIAISVERRRLVGIDEETLRTALKRDIVEWLEEGVDDDGLSMVEAQAELSNADLALLVSDVFADIADGPDENPLGDPQTLSFHWRTLAEYQYQLVLAAQEFDSENTLRLSLDEAVFGIASVMSDDSRIVRDSVRVPRAFIEETSVTMAETALELIDAGQDTTDALSAEGVDAETIDELRELQQMMAQGLSTAATELLDRLAASR